MPNGTPAPADTVTTSQDPATTQPTVTPQSGAMDFIPESFRDSEWAKKYQSPDDFFKGVDNMSKLIGQKEVVNVQGIQAPGENATDEDYNKFYNSLGRPESADKYSFNDKIVFPEGYNADNEKKVFSELAHASGLSQKQADTLFAKYAETITNNFKNQEETRVKSFEQAVSIAFGENSQDGIALAKKGVKAAGLVDIIDSEGLSLNPHVLKLAAELGKLVGEDKFEKGEEEASPEALLKEAKELQNSDAYRRGDKEVLAKVQAAYKKVYG